MITRCIIFLMLMTALGVDLSYAQVVNIEKRRKNKKEGFQGGVSLSLGLKENVSQIIQVKNNLHLQYYKNKHTVLFFNDLSMMAVNRDKLINDGFQHLRYNYDIGESRFLTAEYFTQYQYNTIKLLKTRFLTGGGPRLKIHDNDSSLSFYLAPLVMYEYEQLSDSLDTYSRQFKGDFYCSITVKLNKILNFSHVTYYQPYFANWADYRIASDSHLKLDITKNLSFIVTFNLAYDSMPPEDVPKLFYSLTNGIKYSF